MQFRLPAVLVTLVSIAAVSCSREPGAADGGAATAVSPPAWTLRVESVPAPTGPGTMLPRLTTSDRGVIASWVQRAGAMAQLKFAERTSDGWSQPTTVASGDKWFLSYADPPTVLRRPDGTLLANWLLSTNPIYEGSDLQLSYSRDDGKTWARPVVPHHDGTQQQHAFPSFFELPGNGLGVMWLDGRDVQPSEANPEGGPMALRYATYDAQWKRTAEGIVDPRACECCSVSTAMTSDGVLTAFRDRSDKEVRDIAVSRLENGKWTEPTRVHDDNWEVYACPVNGPMVSANGRNAVVAWFTAKDDMGQAWAAFSSDAGRTWGQPDTTGRRYLARPCRGRAPRRRFSGGLLGGVCRQTRPIQAAAHRAIRCAIGSSRSFGRFSHARDGFPAYDTPRKGAGACMDGEGGAATIAMHRFRCTQR